MIETRLLVSASPSCLGHPSCHSKVENSFGSSELLKGCCEEAKSLTLYASQLVLGLDGNVMLLGAFDELVDLQNSLLGTNPSSMATNNLLPSSEQQLVDCDTVDSGCNGELMDNASASAKKNAMWTGTGHSYIATKGTCMASSRTDEITQASVAEYKVVFTDSAHVLMSTVAQHSVPITAATDQRSFQSHSSGVLLHATCFTNSSE